MAYDVALNRLDHDMVFRKIILPSGEERYELTTMEGADRVAQQIKINLLSFLGEWFLDIEYGVPYLEEILVKNPRMASVETILRQHINSIPGMVRIDNFGMDWERRSRTLVVQFECTTDWGPIKDSFRLDQSRPGRGGT